MKTNPLTPPALDRIRVLDLSSVVFGPYASQILADYGADVIKIESPDGDSTRNTGPAFEPGMAAIFLGVNRNKRSLVLDLKQAAAREALLTLVDQADVFMHSIRPQKMEALGLDPASLRARNPRLIYAGLHGFGNGGAYQGQPAYDDTIQGLSGIADVVARQTDTPRYLPTIAADKTCGLVAAHAILAALFQRERTGQGQFVEVPMFEAMTSYMLVEHFYGRHLSGANQPAGYTRLLTPWRKPYQTTDGYICIMPYTDRHWKRFFEATGNAATAVDPRFTDIAARTQHIAELYELLGGIVLQRSTQDWLDFCAQLEIPATRMNSLDDLEHDPHLQSVDFFVDVPDTEKNTYRFTRSPVRMEQGNIEPAMPPRLGQHTHEILSQAGLSSAQIDAMLASKAAIGPAPSSTTQNLQDDSI
ncbi:CoA transferase [Alcaligenaceae bacterium]|nr:CoA transferase [Alcaligenaceae bacterium]